MTVPISTVGSQPQRRRRAGGSVLVIHGNIFVNSVVAQPGYRRCDN